MKSAFALLAIIAVAILPALALAQVIPQPPGEAVDSATTFNTFVGAMRGGQVALAIGCVLMLVVWVIHSFVWKNVNTKWLPWLAVTIGVFGTGGAALIAQPAAWLTALILGVNAGVSAAGTWGLLGVVRKKE